MSRARSISGARRARKLGPHQVIVARGDKVRSFAVRPGAVISAAVAAILVAAGGLTAGAYTVFKGDFAVASAAEQDQLRQQYESEIAELHREMEAMVSRHLVEREQMNTQLAQLVDRQDSLIERQQRLTGLATEAVAAGIDVLPMLAPVPVAHPLRQGITEPDGVGGPVEEEAPAFDQNAGVSPAEAMMAVAAAADWLETSQNEALETLAEEVIERSEALSEALESLGFGEMAESGIGGPLVLASVDFVSLEEELHAFSRLQSFARELPLGAPLAVIDVTSNYGRRTDPFLGTSAMHTGIDLRAALGTTVRSTGSGVVVTAGVNGGYGNMVEIDHGNGIITAYAHLSRISVSVGQQVQAGTAVGRAGSTGRSTGPHLHYEILRDGRTTDPFPYLMTGQEIAGFL